MIGLRRASFSISAPALPQSRFRYSFGVSRARGAPVIGLREQQWPLYEGQANGRFINKKRPNGQISRSGLRMADFILSRASSLSAARPS